MILWCVLRKVIKTRLQLQGELKAKGHYVKTYNGFFHGIVQIVKHDGIISLQNGLTASLYFQFLLNAFR